MIRLDFCAKSECCDTSACDPRKGAYRPVGDTESAR